MMAQMYFDNWQSMYDSFVESNVLLLKIWVFLARCYLSEMEMLVVDNSTLGNWNRNMKKVDNFYYFFYLTGHLSRITLG